MIGKKILGILSYMVLLQTICVAKSAELSDNSEVKLNFIGKDYSANYSNNAMDEYHLKVRSGSIQTSQLREVLEIFVLHPDSLVEFLKTYQEKKMDKPTQKQENSEKDDDDDDNFEYSTEQMEEDLGKSILRLFEAQNDQHVIEVEKASITNIVSFMLEKKDYPKENIEEQIAILNGNSDTAGLYKELKKMVEE
jgi:hypothetical protein